MLAITLLLSSPPTFAQQIDQASVPPAPSHSSVSILTENTFQQVLASSTTARRTLRISNNNTNGDSCWVFIGSGRASKEASYAVNPGKDYVRYWPFAPSDAIQATCATSSDTLDMEYQ
ncbi:MAG: hypothetical protein WB689_05210 [Xanthobacteraceae bacterium]